MTTTLELDGITLARLVAVCPEPDRWNTTGCVAWMEAADKHCPRDRAQDYLCKRHHSVALNRAERLLERIKADRAKARARREERERELVASLPELRQELAQVQAEIDRRDPPAPTTDRAACAAGVKAVQRYQEKLWSPANMARVAMLCTRREELHDAIARGEALLPAHSWPRGGVCLPSHSTD